MTNGIGSTLGSTFNVGAFSKRHPPDADLKAQVSSIYKDNFSIEAWLDNPYTFGYEEKSLSSP